MKTLLFLFALGLLPNDAGAAVKQYLLESTIIVEGRKLGANLAVGLELGRPASVPLLDEADRPVGQLIIKAEDLSAPGAPPIQPLCTGG